jgi:hypothetical protein
VDNPGYFLAFLAVGCVVVGVPWAIANRIIAAARARRLANLPQPAPIDHEAIAQHLSNVIGPMEIGDYIFANMLHLRTISEHGVLTLEQMQQNIGVARRMVSDFDREQSGTAAP